MLLMLFIVRLQPEKPKYPFLCSLFILHSRVEARERRRTENELQQKLPI